MVLLAGGCGALPARETPPSAAQLDARLTIALERRLFADQRLCPYPIDVNTRNGDVSLSGWVGTQAQRQRAEAMALDAGARQVHNRLVLRPLAMDRQRC